MEAGDHPLWAFVDHTCLYEELSETNNVYTKTIAVQPPRLPDLAVTSFTADPNPPAVAEGVAYTVVIQNQGAVATSRYNWAGLYLDRDPAACGDSPDLGANIPLLGPGASYTVTWPARVPPAFETEGAHTARVLVDYWCAVEEDRSRTTMGPRSLRCACGEEAGPDHRRHHCGPGRAPCGPVDHLHRDGQNTGNKPTASTAGLALFVDPTAVPDLCNDPDWSDVKPDPGGPGDPGIG